MNEIMIAGGGTGGHVYPALAIAHELSTLGNRENEIHLVGAIRGLEAREFPKSGFRYTLLPGRGIPRTLSLQAIRSALSLVVGTVKGIIITMRMRPRVVVSVGGFAAAPCCIAAVLLRIPLLIAESNAVPGATHRLVARFARASAVAWPNTPLPRRVVTGNPVREAIQDAAGLSASDRTRLRQARGVPLGVSLVVIMGGSLGARSINRAAVELHEQWNHRDDVALIHVVGNRDYADESLRVADSNKPLWSRSIAYENRVDELLGIADVMVARAGATTCAELCVAGVPAVLVPLSHTPGDHQVANAQALVDGGAAEMIRDDELTGESLAYALDAILNDEARRTTMREAARALGQPNAARRVAELVDTVMNHGS